MRISTAFDSILCYLHNGDCKKCETKNQSYSSRLTRLSYRRRFCQETLGLEFVADDRFALVFKTGGVMLRIQKVEAVTLVPYTMLGWQVSDIYATIAELESKHVAFENYPHIEQDNRNVWQTPSGARVAWFKDPVGNVLSLTQS